MRALLPSGKLPTTRVRRRISRLSRSIMLLVRILLRCPSGNSGSRYVVVSPTPPAQAVGRGLQPPAFHLRGDLFGLGEGRLPGFHGEHGP